MADGPAVTPEAVPGARFRFGLDGTGEDGGWIPNPPSPLSLPPRLGEGIPRPTAPVPVLLTRFPMAPPVLSSSGAMLMPASSRMRSSLNLSLRLCLVPFTPSSPSPSSSSLLSIISGLLVRVAIELAVFRLGEIAAGGETAESLDEFLESQDEKAVVSFRAGGGGAVAVVEESGGEAIWALDGASFVGGGDQGMFGRALVMLLKEIVLDASFDEGKGLSSSADQVNQHLLFVFAR